MTHSIIFARGIWFLEMVEMVVGLRNGVANLAGYRGVESGAD